MFCLHPAEDVESIDEGRDEEDVGDDECCEDMALTFHIVVDFVSPVSPVSPVSHVGHTYTTVVNLGRRGGERRGEERREGREGEKGEEGREERGGERERGERGRREKRERRGRGRRWGRVCNCNEGRGIMCIVNVHPHSCCIFNMSVGSGKFSSPNKPVTVMYKDMFMYSM